MGQQGDNESRDETNDGVCPCLRGRTMEVKCDLFPGTVLPLLSIDAMMSVPGR
jgi:hypothetical protein